MDVKKYFLIALMVLCTVGISSLYGLDDSRLLRDPDIHGNTIVFSYGGDLWLTTTSGGNATRLTTHPGLEANPFFSPDGQWIAFTGQYDGNTDVYVIPATGGNPQRLTYHPDLDFVTGWSADSKYVYFSTFRESFNRYSKIFKIAISGGLAESLPMPMAWLGSESPDGKYYAYTKLSNRQSFQTWRRYRGGHAPFIWIFNYANNSVKMIPHTDSNDSFPNWMGKNVYFLSDRDRVMNLYAYDSQTDELHQLTQFTGADIKSFGTGDGQLVFEREGYLYLFNIESKQATKLTINIPGDLVNIRPGFKKAGRLINDASLSPTGKRVAFEARGEIVTVPAEKGDMRNLTRTTDKAERTPAWSPDGNQIAYFGEYNDQYALFIIDQKGETTPKIFSFEKSAYYVDLLWSPDSKKLLFQDHIQNLYYLDTTIPNAKAVKIDTDNRFLCYISASWSPDSQWVAYTKSGKNLLRSLYLYSLKDNKSTRITDAMSDVDSPAFDQKGKYLFFSASTNQAFDLGWVDLTGYPYNPDSSLYLVVLSAKESSPFKPESDEEEKKAETKDDSTNKKESTKDTPTAKTDEKKDKATVIDLDGIGNRIISLPIRKGRYYYLKTGLNKLYFLEMVESLANTAVNLHAFDMTKRKDEIILNDIGFYEISANGEKILYSKGDSQWQIADSNGKSEPGKGMIDTSQIELYSEPQKEWRQMLYEAWRINREYFYDPGMHGQDWPAVWQQYSQYVPYIAHREDLNYIIGQLIGELCVGHAYVGGGEYPEINRVPGGLLGADYEIKDGYYRFKKIYAGENWNPDLRSPLKEPGIDVKEGDYLLEVNGQQVKSPVNIYSFFEKTANKQVIIKVNTTPDLKNARTYTVVPLANERMLRQREWIESNRKKVEELSGGKIGYVYLPDTANGGYEFFNRYFFSHLDKEGIVLDERFNGGGMAADYIIELLNRPLFNYWISRWGVEGKSAESTIVGPKTMIIDEYAGSGGDAMPYYFKKRNIGKLVGKRTWGGLVGITGYPSLLDGGYVTSPSVGFMSTDGEFGVENVGVAPDIEVEQIPAEVIKGRDPQLETAVKVVLDELSKNPLPKLKKNPFPRGR